MQGGTFQQYQNDKDPTIRSWLNALYDARGRTEAALHGINPWDAVVQYMREQHHLLIGEARAEKTQIEANMAEADHPTAITLAGRNLLNGLPTRMEVTSTEIRAIDNSAAVQPYVDWSPDAGGRTIGGLLYEIAAHEVNWLFVGVLQEAPSNLDEIMSLFELNAENVVSFVRAQSLAQHYQRLRKVRGHLINAYQKMTLEEFQRPQMEFGMFCSAEWIAHELCQFEAERRSQIISRLTDARAALDTKAQA